MLDHSSLPRALEISANSRSRFEDQGSKGMGWMGSKGRDWAGVGPGARGEVAGSGGWVMLWPLSHFKSPEGS